MGMDAAPIPASATPATAPGALRRALVHPLALWIGFLLVHLIIGGLALHQGKGLGDVYFVYKPWAQLAAQGTEIVGVNSDWVYPFGALVPVMLPLLFGADNYVGGWLTLVLLLDAAAFATLIVGRDPRRIVAAWWWLGFLLLLGPVAVGRLDSVAAALAIVGLLWLAVHERAAVVLLTVATWIKVWPAAVLVAAVVALRSRWRIVLVAAVTSAVIVAVPLIFGAGMHLLSFITMQTGRGIQIEAPVSTFWMWQAAFHTPGAAVYYDSQLITFQVSGSGTELAGSLMNPLLAVTCVVVALLGIRSVHRGTPYTRILPELSLAIVTALIAFNKVGSPQYITWLAAPVVIGLVYQGRGFRTPAILVLVTAGLTQVFYPFLYDYLLIPDPGMVAVLTVRNLMYFVILGWAIGALWRHRHADDAVFDTVPARVWPFRTPVAAAPSAALREETP
ncbi:glycosyltransferase 87 family protein [Leifsonia aquatica]|uniref:glycosyltransferase 87 family protein n=1 Tax=Leifsonia aquatica TaxID=144185 RepID=UPI00046840D0|nr:glycosyltransferase 87 family protein [Leifsonia aquatica]